MSSKASSKLTSLNAISNSNATSQAPSTPTDNNNSNKNSTNSTSQASTAASEIAPVSASSDSETTTVNPINTYTFSVDQNIRCTNVHGEVFDGHIIAYDLRSRLLILKCPSSKSDLPSRHDIHYIYLDGVVKLDIVREPSAEEPTPTLPAVIIEKVDERKQAALEERARFVEMLGKGVSDNGLHLFSYFSKRYIHRREDLKWNDHSIVVFNEVEIKPPYKASNCIQLSSAKADAVEYVRDLVNKFWDDLEQQQKEMSESSNIS